VRAQGATDLVVVGQGDDVQPPPRGGQHDGLGGLRAVAPVRVNVQIGATENAGTPARGSGERPQERRREVSSRGREAGLHLPASMTASCDRPTRDRVKFGLRATSDQAGIDRNRPAAAATGSRGCLPSRTLQR